jgi:hypothetical protein
MSWSVPKAAMFIAAFAMIALNSVYGLASVSLTHSHDVICARLFVAFHLATRESSQPRMT